MPLTQCVEFNIPNGLAVEGLRKVPKNRKLEMQSNVWLLKFLEISFTARRPLLLLYTLHLFPSSYKFNLIYVERVHSSTSCISSATGFKTANQPALWVVTWSLLQFIFWILWLPPVALIRCVLSRASQWLSTYNHRLALLFYCSGYHRIGLYYYSIAQATIGKARQPLSVVPFQQKLSSI